MLFTILTGNSTIPPSPRFYLSSHAQLYNTFSIQIGLLFEVSTQTRYSVFSQVCLRISYPGTSPIASANQQHGSLQLLERTSVLHDILQRCRLTIFRWYSIQRTPSSTSSLESMRSFHLQPLRNATKQPGKFQLVFPNGLITLFASRLVFRTLHMPHDERISDNQSLYDLNMRNMLCDMHEIL